MNIKSNIFYTLGLILVCSLNNTLFSLELYNNSMWDIKYKTAEPGDNRQKVINQEKIVLAGETVDLGNINYSKPFSIRRSGKGSSYVTHWTAVPIMEIFKRDIGRGPSQPSRNYKETLIIESGLTGWNFRMESIN